MRAIRLLACLALLFSVHSLFAQEANGEFFVSFALVNDADTMAMEPVEKFEYQLVSAAGGEPVKYPTVYYAGSPANVVRIGLLDSEKRYTLSIRNRNSNEVAVTLPVEITPESITKPASFADNGKQQLNLELGKIRIPQAFSARKVNDPKVYDDEPKAMLIDIVDD